MWRQCEQHEDGLLFIPHRHRDESRTSILCADVAGSTRLYEQYGDRAAQADIARCLEMLAEVSAQRSGRIVKTVGDELVCAFEEPADAAMAAGEMHLTLRDASHEDFFETVPLRVKVGWHHGTVTWLGDDPMGEAAVIARQVIQLAKPEEILTSETSLRTLPAGLRDSGRLIDRIRADVGGHPLDVYAMPWETDDITEIRVAGNEHAAAGLGAMLLEHAGRLVRVDAWRPHVRLGRANDNDLTLGGHFASRHHAEIVYRRNAFRLRDNSTNGTVIFSTGSDGQVVRVHREEVRLPAEGWICLGLQTDGLTGKAVRFRLKSS